MTEGLVRMLELCKSDQLAFWTSGYASDGERLNDELRCYRLGENHPEYFSPPHLLQRRSEGELRLSFQQRELRGLLYRGDSPESIQQLLHQLLTNNSTSEVDSA